ncbi:PAS domain S-box protein [Lysinibacillus sp. BW-2-10]|uniref:PAS domain S-box protein n=1 Tax=Lysinibacillus sp. BW-2-10 TaxID=2590030 RepID=UPI001180057F|nr:PAS domain S-box protein [Lysinibacillus sp. BW-2-10]TSI05091.1 PAS domain S-box protein [Lysinibacillus sp. BW-2-10]
MSFNQEMFETILTHTSDMLLIVDENRHIIYSTPSVYEITGYTPEELNDVDVFIIVHPEDRELMMHRHKHLLDSGKSNSTEYRMVRKNGEIRYFECKTTPLPGTENYLQVVSTRDVTERKRMELELEYHKNRHEVLQNSLKSFSNDLTVVMKLSDLEERIVKELFTILPNSNPKILTAIPNELSNEQDLQSGKIAKLSSNIFIKLGERKQHPYIISLDATAMSEPMEFIWLETFVNYSVMVFENLNMIENLMYQLETTTLSKETPQWVLRMMFNLQEQQRLTLSSDLHDTVLQDQIDLYRRLETLLKRSELNQEAKVKLIEIEQGLLDIIHSIRATCNELRPPLLRELGLEKSLENLFEHVQLTSTYRILFTSKNVSQLSISEEQTIGIYRIVQEFLHYAEEHSKANVVNFDLSVENEHLRLVYRDDGLTMGPLSPNMRITSASQRAQSLGGKMDFTSSHGSAFMATLELPIHLERSLV